MGKCTTIVNHCAQGMSGPYKRGTVVLRGRAREAHFVSAVSTDIVCVQPPEVWWVQRLQLTDDLAVQVLALFLPVFHSLFSFFLSGKAFAIRRQALPDNSKRCAKSESLGTSVLLHERGDFVVDLLGFDVSLVQAVVTNAVGECAGG